MAIRFFPYFIVAKKEKVGKRRRMDSVEWKRLFCSSPVVVVIISGRHSNGATEERKEPPLPSPLPTLPSLAIRPLSKELSSVLLGVARHCAAQKFGSWRSKGAPNLVGYGPLIFGTCACRQTTEQHTMDDRRWWRWVACIACIAWVA
jgi:hypothetical protein